MAFTSPLWTTCIDIGTTTTATRALTCHKRCPHTHHASRLEEEVLPDTHRHDHPHHAVATAEAHHRNLTRAPIQPSSAAWPTMKVWSSNSNPPATDQSSPPPCATALPLARLRSASITASHRRPMPTRSGHEAAMYSQNNMSPCIHREEEMRSQPPQRPTPQRRRCARSVPLELHHVCAPTTPVSAQHQRHRRRLPPPERESPDRPPGTQPCVAHRATEQPSMGVPPPPAAAWALPNGDKMKQGVRGGWRRWRVRFRPSRPSPESDAIVLCVFAS